MQEAHTVDSSRHSAASKSRISKFLAGGIAVVGAGAIAVSPVTPVVDDIKVQERAVALTAVADPIVEIQRFFAETRTNLQLLSINTPASSEALAAAFNSANLFGELANIFALNASNPLPLVTRLLNFQAVYGDDLEVALFGWDDNPLTGPTANNPSGIDPYDGVFDRVVEAFEGFGPTLADILTYDPPTTDPNQGPVTNAVFEANFYFVLNILDAFRPLIGATPSGIVPLFSIPGDFLGGEVPGGFDGALPGVERLDNLVNVFNEQTFTRAITGPFQTMAFQIADILDDTQAALDAGNSDAALNELVNLPVRVTNAFVNGFVPSFSTCTAPGCSAEWPSLIDATTPAPGLIKYTLVDFQNQLITALGGTPPAAGDNAADHGRCADR